MQIPITSSPNSTCLPNPNSPSKLFKSACSSIRPSLLRITHWLVFIFAPEGRNKVKLYLRPLRHSNVQKNCNKTSNFVSTFNRSRSNESVQCTTASSTNSNWRCCCWREDQRDQ